MVRMKTRQDFSVANTPGDLSLGVEYEPGLGKPDSDDLPQDSRLNPTSVRVDRIEGRTTTTELKKLFKPFGRILEVGILESRMDGNRALISATITFNDALAATNAMRELDGFELRGLPVRVAVLGESEGKDVESY
jgi:RNA recognition motif-containing protein